MTATLTDRAQSFGHLFVDRVAKTPNGEAFRYRVGDDWKSLTWAQTKERVFNLAAGLVDLGVAAAAAGGDRRRPPGSSGSWPTWRILCAGAATTTVYPSTDRARTSPTSCGDSESVVLFAEDAEQAKKALDADLPRPQGDRADRRHHAPSGDVQVLTLGLRRGGQRVARRHPAAAGAMSARRPHAPPAAGARAQPAPARRGARRLLRERPRRLPLAARAGACVIAVDHRSEGARPALALRRRRCSRPIRPTRRRTSPSWPSSPSAASASRPSSSRPTTRRSRLSGAHAERLAGLHAARVGLGRLEPLQHKRHQYEAAARAGVATPRTAYPANRAEAERVAAELRYPAIVKPSDPIPFKRRFGRPALVCAGPEELLEAFDAAAGSEPMLQEVVPGDDSSLWTVGTYTNAEGRPLGIFCGRKLLQMPARLRHVPGRRGALARRRRRAGARAARRARLPRHRADRVPAGRRRRHAPPDGGQPAALAVARARARLRRRPAAHRLRGHARPTRSRRVRSGPSTTDGAGSPPWRTCARRTPRAPGCARRSRRCAAATSSRRRSTCAIRCRR